MVRNFPSVTQLFKKRVSVGQRILSTEDLKYLTNCDANFVSDEETDEDKTTFQGKGKTNENLSNKAVFRGSIHESLFCHV